MNLLWIGIVFAALPAWADTVITGYQEDIKSDSRRSKSLERQQAEAQAIDSSIVGSIRSNYQKFTQRVKIPGTISSAPVFDIAKIIGPKGVGSSFRIGDIVFLRWIGTPGPREGERYSTFTPALVLQSLQTPSEFTVVQRNKKNEEQKEYRRAGYFYESTGVIRIRKVTQGLVEGVVDQLSGQISIGDQLMPELPLKKLPTGVSSGIQLSAAVVSGSPTERVSTTPRSFIYINRGSRDGITEGRIFQSVEQARLEDSTQGPDMVNGEAIVVHVSDAFSVAMITKQFDVIRVGSLLKSKQGGEYVPSLAPLQGLTAENAKTSEEVLEEVPNLGELNDNQDKSLPEPPAPLPEGEVAKPRIPQGPSLSELDALERANKFNSLSEEERNRLGTLSRQEKIDVPAEADSAEAPAVTPLENSFGGKKNDAKPKKKRAQKSRDEEELNQLMMQN